MRIFGLIGFPLGHSFSSAYFAKKFESENIQDAKYLNFPLESIEQLPKLIGETGNLKGLNVTIPYKQRVIPYLDELSVDAKEIGAVNTIKIVDSGNNLKLYGYNTDVYGLKESIIQYLRPQHDRALILGTGGASKAVEFVLKGLGIAYKIVSRNPQNPDQISYSQIDKNVISEYLLIVNSSPVGMYPKIDEYPDIPYNNVTSRHLLFDLVYNPLETVFMKKGMENGATVVNGLQMLQLQAERAWEIWNE